MNIPEDIRLAIEQKLRELAELDPADLPQPAAELVELLGGVLEDVETT